MQRGGQGRVGAPTKELDEEGSWEKLWFPRKATLFRPSFRSGCRGCVGPPELTEGSLLGKLGLEPWFEEDARCKGWCVTPLFYKVPWFVGTSRRRVGCGLQSGILDFLLMETEGSLVILTVSVAIFPLVFLFIVLCGGGIEAQVST